MEQKAKVLHEDITKHVSIFSKTQIIKTLDDGHTYTSHFLGAASHISCVND